MIRPSVFSDLPAIVAGFTTRDFAPHAEGTIDEARRRLGTQFGFAEVASVGQVHGNDVATVHEGSHTPHHDGLVTDRPGLLLTTISADCALVLLTDAEAGVVGACHSGWRGTVAGVMAQTVAAMQRLGAESARMRAYVGPCISSEAFEVGDEVAAQFEEEHVVRRPEWPRPHVDLRGAVAAQLRAAGVPEAQTEVDDACTASDLDRFYSYRAEGGTAGRLIGFIGRRGEG